ncbi:MAG: MarR family transcriptional regulator [Anaerolineae bacterium]|nr:MarR family transcriptional regulator [Anaerolineae bacterium]
MPFTSLIALLQLLADGGLHPPAALAQQLGLSEALVSAMIEELTRRGYLAPVPAACDASCASCGLKQACRAAPVLLTLTPKGRRAVEEAVHPGRPPEQAHRPRLHE